MSQLRQDPLTGSWVILAHGRSARPNEFPLRRDGGSDPADCPFCPGNEQRTTPEILALGRPDAAAPNTPGWSLRVVPNKYPALRPDVPDESGPGSVPGAAGGLLRAEPGAGAHEVVIYAAGHGAHLGTLDDAAIVALLRTVRGRHAALAADPAHRHVLAFVNHGAEAGATLSHPHLQILAGPVVPGPVGAQMKRLAAHREATGNCLLCDLAAAEERDGARLVAAGEHWLAIAPWASRFAWQVMLVPRRHHGGIDATGDGELRELAALLGRVVRGLDRIHGNPPLNVLLHAGPTGDAAGLFHWHVEICPRLARLAGFEAGTGYAINSTAPEEAAARLREGSE